tara:strand:+ start:790 stop:2679 length:1890 start_codon:yes stop_codon:yes gene_type:complete
MAYNKISNKTQEKDIKYLNKDFNTFRSSLLDFTKTYYPNTFNDFTEGSPGLMFMDMAAYVGDVLSYYVDTQLQETFLDTAQERTNLFHLAYTLGYRPKVTSVASTNLDIFQLIPSKGPTGDKSPDFDYALTLSQPTVFNTEQGISFTLQNSVVFEHSSSFDPTDISVYSVDNNGEPFYYLLKKSTPVISAQRVTKTFDIEDIQKFLILNLTDNDIISIQSIIDSDGNEYTEVPYLAQDTVFEDIANVQGNTISLYEHHAETPYLLKIKQVPRRFATRFTSKDILEIQFGAGDSSKTDEEILPIPDNIGLGGRDGRSKLDQSIDPSNFLHSQTYGKAPSNTTLTVNYLRGGGISSNVLSQTITQMGITTINNKPNLNGNLLSFCKESLACSNSEPATGGGSGDTTEDIRLNTLANFSSQQRIITKEDYMVRTLSMPSIYGSIAKAYVVKSSDLTLNNPSNVEPSQISSNLYILGYNRNKKLTTCNTATKTNLSTYLNYYKPLTDSINLMDAFIINFGIDFEITTFRNNNNQQVILNCISELKNYFNIDKWQINQPIIESEVYNLIGNVKGVQSVINVTLKNLAGAENGYSKFKYNFETATKQGIIYPSLDPSIFEIKYLNSDIKGNIKQY